MSTPNRVAKGVPTGGQFAAGAKTESGVSLGTTGVPVPAYAPAYARPSAPSAAKSPLWSGLSRVVSFGLDKNPNPNRAEKASAVSQGTAMVGSGAMVAGSIAGAPAVAAAAGVVLVASSVVLLASTIANRGKK